MNQTLFTLICPPSLERPVTNWLLEQEIISGFTSMQAYGHGSDPKSLTLIEQVEGRKKQIMFQMHLTTENAELMLESLNQEFSGTNIHYWLTPVIQSGSLSKKETT
jgi:hypothetical protein